MVRIQIKGGVWKNSEDEILKVAVMKYGKNQWARISSLLVRKSAKQCKARWFEWLDPSIKKTEWTREEEEKLLHLAKIMPTQWRTIAPIVGRTAAQCLEHYEKLLDAAQEKDGDFDPADDPRRLRPGEIDPLPEVRPARPDAVDMDEDEKEMLSEARARLANTKGKKAKRKAREKQLEEARRLASLQKKRELRAAGIEIRKHKRKRKYGMDYNEEIPFEKRPAPGFFDVTKDRQLTIDMKNDPAMYNNVDLRELEGKRRDEEEERERKKDAKRQKLHRKNDLPAHLLQINKMNDPEFIQRRTNLTLPAPQISDAELHNIAKIGGVVAAPPVGGSGATKTLLASYGGATPLPNTAGLRTPRTPMGRDVLLEEAQNLIALTTASTPLLGGENAELNPTDFGGMTPRPRTALTPARGGGETPSRTPGGRTPAGNKTPATPSFRDGLHINEGLTAEEAIELGSRRAQMRSKDAFKRKLAQGLNALPKATNEYMLIKPELPPEVADPVNVEDEDAEDVLEKVHQQAKALEEAVLRKRHTVIQRSLPRPKVVNIEMERGENDEEEEEEKEEKKEFKEEDVKEMLRAEMVQMLKYDAYTYPPEGEDENDKKKKKKKDGPGPKLSLLEEDDLLGARELIAEELSAMGRPFGKVKKPRAEDADSSDSSEEDEEAPFVPFNTLTKAWELANSKVAFLPFKKQYGSIEGITEAQKVQVLKQEFALAREQLLADNKRASKLEEKINILTGGYRSRAAKLQAGFTDTHKILGQCIQEKGCFGMLMGLEMLAIPQRTAILEREATIISRREAELQSKYAALKKERDILQAKLAAN